MSHAHSHANTVPRPALLMALGLVVLTIVMVVAVRVGLAEREAVPAVERARTGAAPVAVRTLAFADMPTGAVQITDAETGRMVASLHGEGDGGGFVRGVLRGMARERQLRGVGQQPPFTLTLWQDGSLSLNDAATGRSVELGAFGPDNRAAFMRFLELERLGDRG
jgi:putative photosynthetic complex assembly protein